MMKKNNSQKGMALTIAMITMILLSLIAGYALTLSYNQHRLFQSATGKRIKIYYAAQAGVADAQWRIRTNNTTNCIAINACYNWAPDIIAPPPLDFTNNAYFVTYGLDINGDGAIDVLVNIGAVNGNGLRPIISEGVDHYV